MNTKLTLETPTTTQRKMGSQRKILGGVMKDMELAPEVDWQALRNEIMERLHREEMERRRKIEKAKKLQNSWDLTR